MNFLFCFFIFFIIIISNSLFLFNEEFLILISFIAFCFVTYDNLSSQFQIRFSNKIFNINKLISASLDSIQKKLLQKKEINLKSMYFKNIFVSLKKHYSNFSLKFFKEFLIYLKVKEKNRLINKLIQFTNLEKDYSKFITSVILKKLNQINTLSSFFTSTFKVKRFKTISSINRLKLINKI